MEYSAFLELCSWNIQRQRNEGLWNVKATSQKRKAKQTQGTPENGCPEDHRVKPCPGSVRSEGLNGEMGSMRLSRDTLTNQSQKPTKQEKHMLCGGHWPLSGTQINLWPAWDSVGKSQRAQWQADLSAASLQGLNITFVNTGNKRKRGSLYYLVGFCGQMRTPPPS